MSNHYYNSKGLIGIVLSNSEHGWSTYNNNSSVASRLLFDPIIVELILDEWDDDEINAHCIKMYYKKYHRPPGFFNLRVEFIPEGKQFIVLRDNSGEYIRFIKDLTVYSS